MTFNKYEELLAVIKSYVNRTDTEVTEKFNLWVSMAHDDLDRDLIHPALQVRVEYTTDTETTKLPIPANLTRLHVLRINDSNDVIHRATSETLHYVTDSKPFPTKFAQLRDQLVLNRSVPKGTTFEYIYNISPPVLKEPGDSNVYLTSCGDYLLFSTVANALQFVGDIESAMLYGQRAAAALQAVKEQLKNETLGGSTRVYFTSNSAGDYY